MVRKHFVLICSTHEMFCLKGHCSCWPLVGSRVYCLQFSCVQASNSGIQQQLFHAVHKWISKGMGGIFDSKTRHLIVNTESAKTE